MEDAVPTSSKPRDTRRSLPREVGGLPQVSDVVDWQLRLVLEITKSEQPEWDSISDFLLEAREGSSGYAVHELAKHDLLLAFDTRRTPSPDLSIKLQETQAMKSPLIYTVPQMTQDPITGFMGPVSYPLSAGVRAALLEQELIAIRLVDLSILAGDFAADGTAISMEPVECDEGYELAVMVAGLEQFRFTPRMVEQLLVRPVALSLSLDPMIAVVSQFLSRGSLTY
jgi:hypothetical protein